MENTKRIKIKVQQRKTSDGRVFNTYKAVSKNGVLIDCKFRKEVTNVPTTDCYIVCEKSALNMQKNTAFKTLWVAAIISVEPVGAVTNEQAARNASEIDEIFG